MVLDVLIKIETRIHAAPAVKGLIYMIKHIGHKIDPCGTLVNVFSQDDIVL